MTARSRLRHRWSDRDVRSPELSIRTCLKCNLQMHSCHDYEFVRSGGDIGTHWKEYFTAGHPDVRLTVMPECVAVEVATS